MDFFKQQPQQPQQEQKGLSDPNPPVDENGKIPGSEQITVNPLDAYNKMYENANKASEMEPPKFAIDRKVLDEVSSGLDFTQGINPDLMEKALSGDTKALLEVIQSVGRNAYKASLEHVTALTDVHLNQRAEFDSKRLNQSIRQQLTSEALSSIPNYTHPRVKAELNRIASTFAAANPDASPKQIAEEARKYLAELYNAMNPPTSSNNKDTEKEEIDWTKYLMS